MSNPMTAPNGGAVDGREPAYPCQPADLYGRPTCDFQNGLTKREAFAMAAMQGWLASSPTVAGKKIDGSPEHAAELCVACVNYADALLAALQAPTP